MEIPVALVLFAFGAILTFAVRVDSPALNLHIVGVILMAVAAAGIYFSRRGNAWVRKIVVMPRRRRRARFDDIEEAHLPPVREGQPARHPRCRGRTCGGTGRHDHRETGRRAARRARRGGIAATACACRCRRRWDVAGCRCQGPVPARARRCRGPAAMTGDGAVWRGILDVAGVG